MTREQARREIDSLDYYLQNHTDDYGEESHTAMMMAKDALSSSENPNKWIPVSKRLPEDSGYYLTTTMYGDVYCDYWAEIGFDRQENVIAWQPLPAPYKAESEDKG